VRNKAEPLAAIAATRQLETTHHSLGMFVFTAHMRFDNVPACSMPLWSPSALASVSHTPHERCNAQTKHHVRSRKSVEKLCTAMDCPTAYFHLQWQPE
jgi:hypothetical protein